MIFMHPPYGAEIGIPYAGAEWGAEKNWQKVNGRNKCIYIDHTDAVSYTHLDVYKRQPSSTSIIPDIETNFNGFTAV